VPFDVAGGHALGIHRQDFLLDVARKGGLLLFDQFRLELPFAVSGHLNIHVAEAGFQRLFAMAVPAVVGIFIAKIVLAVAKLFIQFALKALIHKGCDHVLEQLPNILHGFDPRAFHELSELRPACFLLRGDSALCHTRNLHAVSILSQLGGLHKMRDGLFT